MISVIIPVYNTEKYLNHCIRSVLNSTYKDFEVLLIDDGSVDGSLEICRAYCRLDRRVRLLTQKHRGVSEARNRGIQESRGEWLVFVDSDDFISEDFFDLIAQKKHQSCDLLIFDFLRRKKRAGNTADLMQSVPAQNICTYSYILSDGVLHKGGIDHGMPFRHGKKERLRLLGHLLNGTQLTGISNISLFSPWAKAYKKSVAEQFSIRFPEDLAIGEDRIFNIEYLLHIQSCMYIHKTVYCLELRPGSAMHGFSPDYLPNDLRYQRHLKSRLRKGGIFRYIEKSYYNSVLSCMADVLIRGIFHPHSPRTRCENYRLCRMMHRFPIYRRALRYNKSTGVLPRRVLLFCFRVKCFRLAALLAKASYRILEYREEL